MKPMAWRLTATFFQNSPITQYKTSKRDKKCFEKAKSGRSELFPSGVLNCLSVLWKNQKKGKAAH